MLLILNKRSFSLFEIIASILILSLVILGITGIFIAGSRLNLHSRERINSSELGKLFMDPLQMDVRQDTWDQTGNLLIIGESTAAAQKVNNRDFTAEYKIDSVSSTDLRRVTTTINWTEPSS